MCSIYIPSLYTYRLDRMQMLSITLLESCKQNLEGADFGAQNYRHYRQKKKKYELHILFFFLIRHSRQNFVSKKTRRVVGETNSANCKREIYLRQDANAIIGDTQTGSSCHSAKCKQLTLYLYLSCIVEIYLLRAREKVFILDDKMLFKSVLIIITSTRACRDIFSCFRGNANFFIAF